jgi:hypothetical protein
MIAAKNMPASVCALAIWLSAFRSQELLLEDVPLH